MLALVLLHLRLNRLCYGRYFRGGQDIQSMLWHSHNIRMKGRSETTVTMFIPGLKSNQSDYVYVGLIVKPELPVEDM